MYRLQVDRAGLVRTQVMAPLLDWVQALTRLVTPVALSVAWAPMWITT